MKTDLVAGVVIEPQRIQEELLHFVWCLAFSIPNGRHRLHNCTTNLVQTKIGKVIGFRHPSFAFKAEKRLERLLQME